MENSGYGKELRERLEWYHQTLMDSKAPGDKMKGIDTSKWGDNFKYELMDRHEWTGRQHLAFNKLTLTNHIYYLVTVPFDFGILGGKGYPAYVFTGALK